MNENMSLAAFESLAEDFETVTVADSSGALREFHVVASVTAAPTCGPNAGVSATYVGLTLSQEDILFEEDAGTVYIKKVVSENGERYFQEIEDAREYCEIIDRVDERLNYTEQLYMQQLAAAPEQPCDENSAACSG